MPEDYGALFSKYPLMVVEPGMLPVGNKDLYDSRRPGLLINKIKKKKEVVRHMKKRTFLSL